MITQNIRRETDPQKQFEADRKLCMSQINRYTSFLNEAMEELNIVQQKHRPNSEEYRQAAMEIERWRYNIDKANLALKFIRPNTSTDIEYRDKQRREFTANLQTIISRNLDLRFHGTPIYYAEQIIETGGITSTADRYNGYISSTDASGEISASTVETLGQTIRYFADVQAYQRSLPCGCVFALLPRRVQDNELPDVMKAVDFRKNPDQLFGIFTSPENVERVKGWMQEADLSPDKVYTFEGFLKFVNEQSKLIDNGEIQLSSPVRMEQNNFGIEDIRQIVFGRQTGRLAQLQAKLKSVLFTKRDTVLEEKKRDGIPRN